MEAHFESSVAPRASLEACFAVTDLEWRLAQIPDDATCRGAYFNMLDDRAGRLGRATQNEYRRFFRLYRFTAFRVYPVRDYLTRLAILAQIHWGPTRIYEGIRSIQSSAFEAWSSTIVGRATVRLFEPSLVGMLKGVERAFASKMIINYSEFFIDEIRRDLIVTRFVNEFVYIEHAMVGAIEGVARLCSSDVTIEADLDSPFQGRVLIHRDPAAKRRETAQNEGGT